MQIQKTVKTPSEEIQRLKKVIESQVIQNVTKEIVISLKYSSNFWRTLNMPLIDCEVSLTLTGSENCVLTDITTQTTTAAQGDNPARERIDAPTNATFKITDTKLYVPVVTLSTTDDKNFLEQLKPGFKRTIK